MDTDTRKDILEQLAKHGAVSVDRGSARAAIVKQLIDDGIVQITAIGVGWYEVKTLVSILAERNAEIEQLEAKIENLESKSTLPQPVIDTYREYQRMLSLTGITKTHYEAQLGRVCDALAAAMPDREPQAIDD